MVLSVYHHDVHEIGCDLIKIKIHKINTSVILIINQPLIFHFLVNLFPEIFATFLHDLVVTKINKSVLI